MSRLKLTRWQRHRLHQQLKATSDARTYRRTLAVLELDRGRSAADIAAMLGVARQSVHNWVAAFACEPDPAVLRDEDCSGRPPLLDEQAEGLLPSLLGRSPQDLGYPHVDWTVPLLQQELERDLGLRPSDETVRRALWRLGYVVKQSEPAGASSSPHHVEDSLPPRALLVFDGCEPADKPFVNISALII